jgi:hypothetical protein
VESFEIWCWKWMGETKNTWKVLKCGAGNGGDQKYPESFEIWCWKWMQETKNTWKVLKYGAGNGWGRPKIPGKF